jgi:hypothetical protein
MSRIVLDNETGFFDMELVDKVLKCASLDSAKEYARTAISDYENARKVNLQKAHAMVNKSRTKQELAFGMSNFILSFQGLNILKSNALKNK